jgi:hypothetical protein
MKQSYIARVSLAVALMIGIGARAGAQVQQAASPIDDLLTSAQAAFNDLNYARADSIARQVLNAGRTTFQQRQRAMQVIAAAYYPEEKPAQKRDESLAMLKQIVRGDIDVKFPVELTWPGFDSLVVEAKRTTFGVAISPAAEQSPVGPAGMAEIPLRANRPAVFRYSVSPVGGAAPIFRDSVTGTDEKIRFPTMRNERPIFTTGDYEIVIVSTALAAGTDTITTRYSARITAPELTFAPIPVAIDSTRLISERSKRYGWKGVIVGGLVAGGIYGFSSALHADTTLKNAYGPDSKGMGVAVAAGAALIAASFMDKGRQIPGAIAANQRLRDDFGTAIRNAQAENANRIATYRTTIAIQAGAR